MPEKKAKTKKKGRGKKLGVYQRLIEKVFVDRYSDGDAEVPFQRSDLPKAAKALGVSIPKNLGDVVYSIRYRTPMPMSVRATAPKDREWVIEGAGRAKYKMRLVPINRIVPNPNLVAIKIPDNTPEIIVAYSLSDEQALLAKVRYNRLIDVFLGVVSYSLQNHLRTTVKGIGQIEIDEIYAGVDRRGSQYIIPVQAKGGSDQLGVVQTKQDLEYCREKFPALICRAVSSQFIADDHIAMFELTVEDDFVKIVDEKHYRLVPSDQISRADLATYGVRS